jgi:hypothetical protein
VKAQVSEAPAATKNSIDARLTSSRLKSILSSKLLIWLGLTCTFAAMPVFYLKHAHLADPDIWWHMRTGEWMVQNHQIPHADPFSASTLGRPWVDYCWLFDAGSYWIIPRFDLVSIIRFETVMRIVTAGAMFCLLRLLMPGFWKSAVLTTIAMLGMAWVFPPRPGAFSVLFFVLELYVFFLAQRRSNPRLLWILPALLCLWANIHIEFVTGLFLLGVLCLEPYLDAAAQMRRPARLSRPDAFHRQLWLAFAASLVAVMVNPYGPKLLGTVFQYARDSRIYDVIIEFQAMHFRSANDWAVLLLVMLGCFAMGRMRPFRPAWALLMAWAAWMSFRSLREVWLVAILSLVCIGLAQGEEEPAAEPNASLGMAMRLAVAGAVFVALLTGITIWPLSSQKLLKQVADVYPLGAVNYIHAKHLQGPLLNELSWGGFLIYSVPDIPVAMDGRTNVHSQDEIMRAMPLWDGESGWQTNPDLEKANLVISSNAWPLAVLLRSDPRFRIAYEDNTAVLFEAVHSEKSDTISQRR